MQIKEMFITPNKYSRPQKQIGQIKNIVIHWIGNAGTTAENNAKYFDGLKVGKKNSTGDYIYASSHYIIGNDGVVVRCLPESEVAYHASKANSYSIGMEICHPDWSGKPTEKAYDSLVNLLVELCRRYKLEPTQAIIRHYDVTGKVCPKYYVEDVGAFKRLKEEVKGKMGEDKELEKAVKVLQEKGIISSPEVWIKGNYTKDNVRSLVIKVSSYVDKI
ncbi:peptidoglycan recognition family protein [Zhenhengia yiwuensis]|uniref:peptidoglycan recognition protein family protein n=1 Tax=Zhenhengia yiwuensis TaxID=2763666 RepID=UPI002A753B2B|nr:peptidoglycan recognition family protein [Zhenhengia yiwuensis]MDY3368450.1 peptidoglycan recognition family protein [Zhenhengia yiwuensis]